MTPSCEAVLNDFAASHWLKLALVSALERDPVDALADAEILVAVLRRHCGDMQRLAAEAAGADLEALQRELWRDGGEVG